MKINGTDFNATFIQVAQNGSMSFRIPKTEVELGNLPNLLEDATIEADGAVYYGRKLDHVEILEEFYVCHVYASFVSDNTVGEINGRLDAQEDALVELAELLGGAE